MAIYSYTAGEQDLKRFFSQRANRTLQYIDLTPSLMKAETQWVSEIEKLRTQGLLKIEGFFSRDKILRIGEKVDEMVSRREGLSKIRLHSKETRDSIQKGEFSYLPDEALKDPNFSLEKTLSSVGLRSPLLDIPEVADIAFENKLISFVSAYFQVVPVLSYLKIKSTFANDLPIADTQYFHTDFGSYKILKALIYLNDVEKGGGPFCYIPESHVRRFEGWDQKSRFLDEELQGVYGEDCVHRCYGRAGDIFLAETTGFHRGEKPITRKRNILIMTFCVEPEYGFDYQRLKVKRSAISDLDAIATAYADNLEVVP